LVPPGAEIVDKGDAVDADGYSGFAGTVLERSLQDHTINCIGVAGIATEYCVLATVRDALRARFQTFVLVDLIRSIEASPGDTKSALEEMSRLGAVLLPAEKWLELVGK
jgi:nicotinamidase/pyrazinamidase